LRVQRADPCDATFELAQEVLDALDLRRPSA
jgi:hypothetical protein